MAKRRVVKARFHHPGRIGAGEITSSFPADWTDEQIRASLLAAYKRCLIEEKMEPMDPDDKPADPALVEKLKKMLGVAKVDVTIDLLYPPNGDDKENEDE
jgi:hypothetical protein